MEEEQGQGANAEKVIASYRVKLDQAVYEAIVAAEIMRELQDRIKELEGQVPTNVDVVESAV